MESLTREAKVAILKEALSAIGDRIDEVVVQKCELGEALPRRQTRCWDGCRACGSEGEPWASLQRDAFAVPAIDGRSSECGVSHRP